VLDTKLLRNEYDRVKQALIARGGKALPELEAFASVDARRRELLQESEALKNRRNTVSQEVARKKKSGEDAEELIVEMRDVSDRIKALDDETRIVEEQLDAILMSIPNVTHESVPVGASEADNVEIRRVLEPRSFAYEPKPHWEVAASLGIVDTEAAGKVTGSRFVFYKGLGARLERALINFMLDLHTGEHGYEELTPPMIVNSDSLRGTGQLPKFAEDVFKLEGLDYFLGAGDELPPRGNFERERLAEVLYGIQRLLPFGSGIGGARYARPHSPSPVPQGRADQGDDAGELVRRAGVDDGERGEGAAAVGPALSRIGALYGRYRLHGGQDVRPRGMAAERRHVSRDFVLQQHGRLPSAPRANPVSPGREVEAGVRAHAERLGSCRRSHDRRDSGELSAGRRQRDHSGCARSVYGRRDGHCQEVRHCSR